MSARNIRLPRIVSSAAVDQTKTAQLRELRLASEAAGREAGTWGEQSVGEITHDASGATFVYRWNGRQQPDLQKLLARRCTGMTIDEHRALAEWLVKHRTLGFELSMLGWNLSTAEARRVKSRRIAEHKAAGRTIINIPSEGI